MAKDNKYSVLLDTSFFIRLLSSNDPLHQNALGYYKYFLDNEIPMLVSTVSIAEYCVKGDMTELPFRQLRIVPFNLQHASKAGEIARILYEAKNADSLQVDSRLIIPNDSKLFAQAATEDNVKFFVTSDTKSLKVINTISTIKQLPFSHLDIHTSYQSAFGILNL